ncbi:MAG: tetratricopeptide repeat protein [Methylocystis sp.]
MNKAATRLFASPPFAHDGAKRNCRAVGALALAALIGLSGCSKGMNDVTGSIGRTQPPQTIPTEDGALRRFAEEWGRRYDANPKDKVVAMTYARALHGLDQNNQAVAILQGTAIQNPTDMQVLSAYGKALADAGRLNEAAQILSRAHTPERPDWSVVSTQGTIADELGDHDGAREFYREALKIRPDDPTVLSNMGLSYALSRQLPRAEETLLFAAKQPGADIRVRQNLALVLALRGKFEEAAEWSRRDLSPIDAAANIASIRQMISQSNTWRDIAAAPTPAPTAHRKTSPASYEQR